MTTVYDLEGHETRSYEEDLASVQYNRAYLQTTPNIVSILSTNNQYFPHVLTFRFEMAKHRTLFATSSSATPVPQR